MLGGVQQSLPSSLSTAATLQVRPGRKLLWADTRAAWLATHLLLCCSAALVLLFSGHLQCCKVLPAFACSSCQPCAELSVKVCS